MKLICPECGAQYEEGKYCKKCGCPLEMTIKEVLYCPKCGTEVSSGKFCSECGTRLEIREVAEEPKMSEEVFRLYLKAAHLGDADAQFKVAECYYDGEGVEQDEEEAFKWYLKAAQQGHARAEYMVGICYQWGKGIEEDDDIAAEWLELAAEDGVEEAIAYFEEGDAEFEDEEY